MDGIKHILQTVFKDLTDRKAAVDFDKAVSEWRRVVGERASQHTKIVYLTKDKIQVNVDSSVWLHELTMKKKHIQARLQEALKVQKVVLKLGEIEGEV